MRHEKISQLSEKIKTISVAVSLLLTLGGVVIGIFNYLTLNQLQPFGTRISQLEKQLLAHEEDQKDLIEQLATKVQMNDLITRVDKISARVDLIVGKLIK